VVIKELHGDVTFWQQPDEIEQLTRWYRTSAFLFDMG
jgi:hypothetical protein